MVAGAGVNLFKLKTGVAGAGVFGAHHARKLASSRLSEFVGVFDPDRPRAKVLASGSGATVFNSFDELLESVDAVTIAAPAACHYSMAARALERGRHVYVEKPIALTLAEADRLVALSEGRGVTLQIGHQERPVLAAFGLPAVGLAPTRLEFARLGPASGRCEDVSVVLDLMIHDLDLARLFGLGEPVDVSACGDSHEAVATLRFANASRVSLIASRRAPSRRRTLVVGYGDEEVEIDFLARAVRDPAGLLTVREPTDDPLGVCVDEFLAAALAGRPAPIDGRAGRAALAWALAIEDAIAATLQPARRRMYA